MITLIDCSLTPNKKFIELIDSIKVEYLSSKNETEICASDKIIFTAYGDIKSVVKRLHILNLFSLMRMIKKPILGIGIGMQLLTESSLDGSISGLGLIKGRFEKTSDLKIESQIELIGESHLLKNIDIKYRFKFSDCSVVRCLEGVTSVRKDFRDAVVTVEYNNIYGMSFYPEENEMQGLTVLRNFIEL